MQKNIIADHVPLTQTAVRRVASFQQATGGALPRTQTATVHLPRAQSTVGRLHMLLPADLPQRRRLNAWQVTYRGLRA